MKRFTETTKWSDPWFRRLSTDAKLLWQWILDNCDSAGIIDIDIDLAAFQIGSQKVIDTLPELSDKIAKIPCGKWHVLKFIEFQYGSLSEECKPHRPIFQSLQKHQIKGYSKGIDTLQEKEKEKEKDKKGVQGEKKEKARGTLEELKSFALEIGLTETDGEAMFHGLESNGWKRGANPLKDWKAHMRSWKSAGHHPSQKLTGFNSSPLPQHKDPIRPAKPVAPCEDWREKLRAVTGTDYTQYDWEDVSISDRKLFPNE